MTKIAVSAAWRYLLLGIVLAISALSACETPIDFRDPPKSNQVRFATPEAGYVSNTSVRDTHLLDTNLAGTIIGISRDSITLTATFPDGNILFVQAPILRGRWFQSSLNVTNGQIQANFARGKIYLGPQNQWRAKPLDASSIFNWTLDTYDSTTQSVSGRFTANLMQEGKLTEIIEGHIESIRIINVTRSSNQLTNEVRFVMSNGGPFLSTTDSIGTPDPITQLEEATYYYYEPQLQSLEIHAAMPGATPQNTRYFYANLIDVPATLTGTYTINYDPNVLQGNTTGNIAVVGTTQQLVRNIPNNARGNGTLTITRVGRKNELYGTFDFSQTLGRNGQNTITQGEIDGVVWRR